MNPFVNYQQRGVELPAGCKNLFDVLRGQIRDTSSPHRVRREGLKDIWPYLSRLLHSKASYRQLIISCYVPRAAILLEFGPFLVGYRPSGLSAMLFIDDTEPLQEQAVRTVFEEAGFAAFSASSIGGGVEPTRVLRYPLPNAVGDATRLITDVLQRGFGLSAQARLGFDYDEHDAP